MEAHGQRDDYEHYDYPGRYKQGASGKPCWQVKLSSFPKIPEAGSGHLQTVMNKAPLDKVNGGPCYPPTLAMALTMYAYGKPGFLPVNKPSASRLY